MDSTFLATSTWLHYAVAANNHSLVVELLKNGVDTERQDIEGYTPLDDAVTRGDLQMTALLLNHRAKISGYIRSHLFHQNTLSTEILQLLLFRSLDDTPWLIKPILKALKKRQASPTGACIQLLYSAACSGRLNAFVPISHRLLQHTSHEGQTIMHLLADTLLHIKKERTDSQTIEMQAALTQLIENIKKGLCCLIKEGGDINQRDHHAKTAHDLLKTLGKDGQAILNCFKPLHTACSDPLLKQKTALLKLDAEPSLTTPTPSLKFHPHTIRA